LEGEIKPKYRFALPLQPVSLLLVEPMLYHGAEMLRHGFEVGVGGVEKPRGKSI